MPLLLTAFGLTLLAISVILLNTDPKRREVLLARLGLPKQKTTGFQTPPQSLTTEKKNGFGSNTSQPLYADVFPPHRREALADLPPNSMAGPGLSASELSRQPPDYSRLTPDKDVSDSDDVLQHTTPTGFTVEEIRRLGAFPDYATLSGIPLPSPYETFNIETAMPRPYRPYRWPYHQTMCMLCPCIIDSNISNSP